MPMDMLPDDDLLAIFDFCVDSDQHTDQNLLKSIVYPNPGKKEVEAWQTLVHVCRRWRRVVFGSPRRLNLQLVCTPSTPAMDTLDFWPALPLLIRNIAYTTEGLDNIIPVLKRSDRVCQIGLSVLPSQLEMLSAAMQEPFRELTRLELRSFGRNGTVPLLPDSFLGGSVPRLHSLRLEGIPFPGLPNLLLSATHLVKIQLFDIPHSGYISPETMATALSTLASLEDLSLEFESPRSSPDQASRRPPPLTRVVLPVLTKLQFQGVCEYLDDLVARIDAPRLHMIYITFFNNTVFDTPQFIQFIRSTPTLKTVEKARVAFEANAARIHLSSRTSGYGLLAVKISCRQSEWQLSSMERVCTSCLPPISTLEDLYVYEKPYSIQDWQDTIETTLWLELLHPFSAVKNLYLSKELAPRIVPALQELNGGRTTEVLPTLQNIFIEGLQSGPIQEVVGQFVAARRVINHPIAVSRWENSEEDKI